MKINVEINISELINNNNTLNLLSTYSVLGLVQGFYIHYISLFQMKPY